ncbi:MAG: hypothetical protein ABI700_32275, partial [Chloroflexota bacterium]
SPNDASVVVVQEVSYPGWRVEVDGKPADLESVGGLIGVVLPAGNTPHVVYFAYRPPLVFWGEVITIISAVCCIGYLLHLDRIIPRRLVETS